MTTKRKAKEILPNVIIVHGIEDFESGTCCPHCGAEGRYVYTFTCDDGMKYQAMRGCFGRFPKHDFAEITADIMKKENTNKQKYGRNSKLAQWDRDTINAIQSFIDGVIIESEAWDIIKKANRAKQEWMVKMGYASPKTLKYC